MNFPPPPPRNIVPTVEKEVQTELGDSTMELKDTKRRLRMLRQNVSSLLRVILPDLQIADNAVIDDIVAEMIKVKFLSLFYSYFITTCGNNNVII